MKDKALQTFLENHPTARVEQRTPAWRHARLGRFTGSKMSELMVKGRSKEVFGKTALAYIERVASERLLLKGVIDNDEAWEAYSQLVDISNRYMRHGTEWEDDARQAYERLTKTTTHQVGFITKDDYLGASPDAVILNEDGTASGIVEIKCPLPATHMHYMRYISDSDTLKKEKPEYWYQMQTEMLVTGSTHGDFVSFCPFLRHPLHIVHIEADKEAQEEMQQRVSAAIEELEKYIECAKQRENEIHT